MTKVLVTGGAGFIGSAVIRYLIKQQGATVLNVDKLTYAGNEASLNLVKDSGQYHFSKTDITNLDAIKKLLAKFQPDYVMHLAAESHVDRSIKGAGVFVETNVVGTYYMLEAARQYWADLPAEKQKAFRFHHISTDEVYGTLGETGLFTEETPYQPNSPYSASKAGSDHLVRAWHETYGLPVVITNCSNNYGFYHFPEKLIPLMILNALHGKPLPVYGNGKNIRDWLFVDDHAEALWLVVTKGRVGEKYNIGGNAERDNLTIVEKICSLLDERFPEKEQHNQLISFVKDRPGHDFRYAIDANKIKKELGWTPRHTFEQGIEQTVDWYLNNQAWWQPLYAG